MNSRKQNWLIVVLLGALATGCASVSQQEKDAADTEARARQIIIDRVGSAVTAQRELAAVTAEEKSMILRRQASIDVDEVDIDYLGKPQPLLEAISVRYGYRYVETGKRSDLLNINIRAFKQPVTEVLRDVGYQIDSGADVVLDKDAKIIRLIYKKG